MRIQGRAARTSATVYIQSGAVCCSEVRCVAVCCGVLLDEKARACYVYFWHYIKLYMLIYYKCSVLHSDEERCGMMRCVAVCCGVLQRRLQAHATRPSTTVYMQCGAVCCGVLQRLQCVVVCCSVLQVGVESGRAKCISVYIHTVCLQIYSIVIMLQCCSVLQCVASVAVCCSVLQVLQCVADASRGYIRKRALYMWDRSPMFAGRELYVQRKRALDM